MNISLKIIYLLGGSFVGEKKAAIDGNDTINWWEDKGYSSTYKLCRRLSLSVAAKGTYGSSKSIAIENGISYSWLAWVKKAVWAIAMDGSFPQVLARDIGP